MKYLSEYIKDRAGENVFKSGWDCYLDERVVSWTVRDGGAIEGIVRGRKHGRFETAIYFKGQEIVTTCSCPYDWTALCEHAVALALEYEAQDSSAGSAAGLLIADAPGRPDWEATLQDLVATERGKETALGRAQIIFRLTASPGSKEASLVVRATRARIGHGGKGVESPFRFNTLGGDVWLTLHDQAILNLAHHGVTETHTFSPEISDDRVDPILRLLAEHEYVFKEDTDARIEIDLTPVPVNVKLSTDDDVHNVAVVLDDEAWAETPNPMIIGRRLPWITDGRRFAPVLTDVNGVALNRLIQSPVRVESKDWPYFCNYWLDPLLAKADLVIESDAVSQILDNVTPQPTLTLGDAGSALSLQLSFAYGDGPPQVNFGSGASLVEAAVAHKPVLIKRDNEAEKEALKLLEEMGSVLTDGFGFLRGQAAAAFLAHRLPKLETAGWHIVRQTRNWRLNPNPPVIIGKVETHADRFNLQLHIEYGDIRVPMSAALQAYLSGDLFIKLEDASWGALPAPWLQEQWRPLKELAAQSDDIDDHLTIHPYDVPLADRFLAGVVVEDFGATWLGFSKALTEFSGVRSEPTPSALRGELRDYQCEGLGWLKFLNSFGFSGILADDMGLGKTIQAISILLIEHLKSNVTAPSLIVAPTSVIYNWAEELKRFAPDLKVMRLTGPNRGSLFEQIDDVDIVLTSYALLRRDAAQFKSRNFHYIVLDEAQFIKNAGSATARTARSLFSTHRLAMTGTPIENNLGELWSIFSFLMPGLFGSYREFQERYEKPIGRRDSEALDRLTMRLRPFVLRRTKDQVALELPPKTIIHKYCEMTDAQAAIYNRTRDEYRVRVLEEVNRRGVGRSQITVLDALLKLRQICCHPGLLPGDAVEKDAGGKMEAWTDMVRELITEGHRALVFSQFTQMLGKLREWLDANGIAYQYLDGKTRNRQKVIEAFNNGDAPLFLISLKAGGTGLNLTAADYVIHYDPWWNPAVEAQATDRAHRIGQNKHVFAYKLITRNSIEEKVIELQKRKQALFDQVVDAAAAPRQGLSREDIEFLFR